MHEGRGDLDAIVENVEREIMNALDEVIDFGKSNLLGAACTWMDFDGAPK